MKARKPKPTDQEQVQKAYSLLKDFVEKNDEIEPTLWASAMWSLIVQGYISSNVSFFEFARDCEKVIKHYKPGFDK